MNKTLVLYYSKSGNNHFLAHQLARELKADIEEILPRPNAFWLLLVFTWLRWGFGIRRIRHDIASYNRVVLCGPIWMGQLVYPLLATLRRYRRKINQLVFATCCGSTDKMKDDKFGYESVFTKAEQVYGRPITARRAFPILMVLPEDQRENDELIMKTRLSEANFTGEIKDRFDGFVRSLSLSRKKSLA